MARERYELPEEEVGASGAARRILFIAGAILVVVVVAVYFFLGRRDEAPRLATTAAPPRSGPEQVREPESPSPTQPRAGDRARAIIAEIREQGTEPDFPGVYVRAEQFKEDGMLADAHLLHFFAAREGYAPSAMVLGAAYDPNYLSATINLMEGPDPAQAFKWYTKAAEGGEPVARERLDELREWVERAAREGDPEARRVLMQWR